MKRFAICIIALLSAYNGALEAEEAVFVEKGKVWGVGRLALFGFVLGLFWVCLGLYFVSRIAYCVSRWGGTFP